MSGRNRSIPWGDNKSFSCESAYPLFVTASMAYPSARSASTAFHTALRLTPMLMLLKKEVMVVTLRLSYWGSASK